MEDKGTYLLVDPIFPVESFRGVAASMMMRRVEPGPGKDHADYYERWSDGRTVVEWFEVEMLDARFIWFVSPEPKRTAEYFKQYLKAKGVSELVQMATAPDVGHHDLVYLLYRVAYMAPDADSEIQKLYEQRLRDPRPTIRRAALNGFMIRRWRELGKLVEEIANSDPDPEVRSTAWKALKASG